jgi:hypothetical protein
MHTSTLVRNTVHVMSAARCIVNLAIPAVALAIAELAAAACAAFCCCVLLSVVAAVPVAAVR